MALLTRQQTATAPKRAQNRERREERCPETRGPVHFDPFADSVLHLATCRRSFAEPVAGS